MVHFGTPETKTDDPARALTCGANMIAQIETWNNRRVAAGSNSIRVGIGLHYGDVVVGNIGDERRLEYTVLGDTMNVAARLESSTRAFDTAFVASDDVVHAARGTGLDPSQILPSLRKGQAVRVPGRVNPVDVWYV